MKINTENVNNSESTKLIVCNDEIKSHNSCHDKNCNCTSYNSIEASCHIDKTQIGNIITVVHILFWAIGNNNKIGISKAKPRLQYDIAILINGSFVMPIK